MATNSIPKGLQFKNVKPQGFFQEYRDYYVTPVQTYGNVFSVSDVVRMQFNLQDWYIDPYESFIEAEVGLTNEAKVSFNSTVDYTGANPVQFLMMDGPSTSLINDFRLEVNSREIERIREYDQVGNLLADLNMYPEAVDQKDYEGYYSVRGLETYHNYTSAQDFAAVSTTNAGRFNVAQQSTNIPVFGLKYASDIDAFGEPIIAGGVKTTIVPLSESGAAGGDLNINSINLYKFENVNSGYTGAKSTTSVIDSLKSAPETKIGGGTYGQMYNPSQFLGQLTVGNSNFGISSDAWAGSGASNGGNAGYLYCTESPKMRQIDGHNIFLTNLPTSKIVNGQFQGSMYAQSDYNQKSRAYMQIPLLSGVLGVLIPSERWQLIPSSSLGNCQMEFRFNENAFFSHNSDKPDWKVTKFQLKLRLYRFDQALMAQLRNQVQGGIQMHSQVFSMGPIYTIQPNVSVTNNWQINNGIPSIKNLFFWFLSQDYELYWHARKNYKLSHNITSMQLKIGSNYIPQNPIIGHAGNIVTNAKTPIDNSVYLSELHASLNILFDCKKHININQVNFAPNQRPYDVTLASILNISGTDLGAKKKNMLLDAGFSLWNEMRCRGKAVYTFNMEMDKKNDDTMTGMDTTKVRPIELILRADDTNTYNRQSTMYVMFLSDFIVSFGGQETTTDGSG